MRTNLVFVLLLSSALAFCQAPGSPPAGNCTPQPTKTYKPATPSPRRTTSTYKKKAVLPPEQKPEAVSKAPLEPTAEANANIQLTISQSRLADSQIEIGPAQADFLKAQAGLTIAQTGAVADDREVAKANAALLYAQAHKFEAEATTETLVAPARLEQAKAEVKFTLAQTKAIDSSRRWGPWLNLADHAMDGASFVAGSMLNAARVNITQATGPVTASGGNNSNSNVNDNHSTAAANAAQSQVQDQTQQQKQAAAQTQSQVTVPQ